MNFLLRWGRQILNWGSSFLSWGSGTDAPLTPTGELVTQVEYCFDIEFTTGETNYWTGSHNVTLGTSIGNKTYFGIGNIVQVGQIESADGEPQSRIQLVFTIKTPELRKELIQYPERVPVTIRIAYSTDGGETFQLHRQFFRGIALNHRLSGEVYTIDIIDETQVRATIDATAWNNQEQETRWPGDRGFEHLRQLSLEGTNIRWPNALFYAIISIPFLSSIGDLWI